MNNGITALIISDPSPILENKHVSTSSATIDDNEIEDDEDDDDDEDDGSDSDEEESSDNGPKEKLAACSLCIDVG